MTEQDIKDLCNTVTSLRAGDGGMMDEMHICLPYKVPNKLCEGCPCYTGCMNGECCQGLYRTAQAYLMHFHSGACDRKALQKRFDTLADWIDRLLEIEV